MRKKKKEKREGLIGTIVFHLTLLILFLFYGLSHPVPIPETGMRIRFGTSDLGRDSDPKISEPISPVSTSQESTSTQSEIADIVTQDLQDAIEIPSAKSPQEIRNEKQAQALEKQRKAAENRRNAIATKKKADEDAMRKKIESMTSRLKNPTTKPAGTKGSDNKSGDKGKINGAKDGGYNGSGNAYALGDRLAKAKPKPSYECQEEGKVVVDIRVNRNGKVVSAKVGKGTTNTADCLAINAIRAAYKTTWEANTNAPIKQRGKITYVFQIY